MEAFLPWLMSVADPESGVHSQLVKNKSSRLFHVSVHAGTRTTISCGELIFTANHLETITIIADMHREASGCWEQLLGPYLVHHIDLRCSYLSKSVGRGCSDRGAERQTVRSLREYSNWWILCFLTVTPSGFINSLVKRGKACCGLSAFWSKYAGGVLCNGHLDSDCRTQLIPICPCPGPLEGSLAAHLLIFWFWVHLAFYRHIIATFNISQVRIQQRSSPSCTPGDIWRMKCGMNFLNGTHLHLHHL